MTGTDNLRRIRLHYEGVGTHDHTLPAQVLGGSLKHVQRIIYLLAKFHRGERHGQRVRFSYDIERRFALLCQVPEAGGYALPAAIGNPSHDISFGYDEIVQVSDLFHKVTRAVNLGDSELLRQTIPDSVYRKSLIGAYKGTQPPKRTELVFSIEDHEREKLLDGFNIADAFDQLDDLSIDGDTGSAPAYVIGTLVRMDFEEQSLQIKLPNNHALDATYRDDFEPLLLGHPRELVQAHGNVRYDEHGVPTSLTEVDQIIEIDEIFFPPKWGET